MLNAALIFMLGLKAVNVNAMCSHQGHMMMSRARDRHRYTVCKV